MQAGCGGESAHTTGSLQRLRPIRAPLAAKKREGGRVGSGNKAAPTGSPAPGGARAVREAAPDGAPAGARNPHLLHFTPIEGQARLHAPAKFRAITVIPELLQAGANTGVQPPLFSRVAGGLLRPQLAGGGIP